MIGELSAHGKIWTRINPLCMQGPMTAVHHGFQDNRQTREPTAELLAKWLKMIMSRIIVQV